MENSREKTTPMEPNLKLARKEEESLAMGHSFVNLLVVYSI